MKLLFTFFLCSFLMINSNSQVQQQWLQRYNGIGNGGDYPYSMKVDAAGNTYITGSSQDASGFENIATIKYNSSGAQQWVAIYDGPANRADVGYSIAFDGSGNVYVSGMQHVSNTVGSYVIIKYNSSGVQQWLATYNGYGNNNIDCAHSVAVDNLSNVYVSGWSYNSSGVLGIATIKYNTSGIQQWVTRYDTTGGYITEEALAVDGSGNVYITGYNHLGTNLEDYVTIKYNTSGVRQWIAFYNGTGNSYDEPCGMAVDSSGNVYVTGWSTGSSNLRDYLTIKYNSSGVQQWVERYHGPGSNDNQPNAISVDRNNNIYVTGMDWGNGTQGDFATIKYNSSGIQQWVAHYNGPDNGTDEAVALVNDTLGNTYVTGTRNGNTLDDYVTIKYDSSGVQQWVMVYNGPVDYDEAVAIGLDISGNVYVTGNSRGPGTGFDYCTIKYSQLVGVKQVSSQIPSKFSLYQNYPNPFNPSTKIKYNIPLSRGVDAPGTRDGRGVLVTLKIYDILGREVATLVNEQQNPGSYEITWDASKYPSGVYFYQLKIKNEKLKIIFSDTKKLVLIK